MEMYLISAHMHSSDSYLNVCQLNSCQEDKYSKSTSALSTLWYYVSGECVNEIFSRPIAVICCQTTPAVGPNNT
jgi:hypothetical protein